MNSAGYAVARCLSVCLSVTRWYSVETAQHIIKLSFSTLLFASENVLALLRREPSIRRRRMHGSTKKTAIFDHYLAIAQKRYKMQDYRQVG